MTTISSLLRFIVPATLQERLCQWRRSRVFSRNLQQFISDPGKYIAADDPVLQNLVDAWANTWSTGPAFLASTVRHALASRGPILECGSGLTTIVLCIIAQKTNRQVVSLEHSLPWVERVRHELDRAGLSSRAVTHANLKDYGGFAWYDIKNVTVPDGIALVVCDGPPSDTKGGRYGVLPVVFDHLGDRCVILLDDASREGEQAVLRRWHSEFGAAVVACAGDREYAEVILSKPRREGRSAPEYS